MFKNLKLTTKIVLAMLVSIVGMLVIGLSSYTGLNKIGAEIEEIAEYQIPINTLITELEKDVLEEEILTYKLIIASKDPRSKEFKDIAHHIDELKKETKKTLKEAEHLVQEAIEHNNDPKTKASYTLFLKELQELEHEQSEFILTLEKYENNLKTGNTANLKHEQELLEKELTLMDKNIQKLMHQMEELLEHSTHQAAKDERNILKTIEITIVIVLLLSILVSIYLTKSVKKSIGNFQHGLLGFFSYLNRESSDVNLLESSANDEFGNMAKVVNTNIDKTKAGIEEDRHVINDTISVLAEFEQGDFNQRVNTKTSNPALSELTKLLNQMGINLEKNINGILHTLEEYSNNNYLNEVDASGIKEHLLRLANGINSLGASATETLVLRKRNGLTLQSSAITLKSNVNSLSQSSNEAAASLEETAAALEEITSTIISNSDNVTSMAKYANHVTDSVKSGEVLANDTMHAMDEINEKVTSINEAITMIDQIAFQTNILSLNAAVEAATAGEAGKGFAVVAQEVRNLAARSAEAAKEIKDIVEAATVKADSGKEIAKNMLDGYKNLNQDIDKTIELISSVNSASKEQQTGIEQINDAVSELDQQTQRNSAAAMETNDIAITTEKLAEVIIDGVNKNQFKGKDDVEDRRGECRDLNYEGQEKRKVESQIKSTCTSRFNNPDKLKVVSKENNPKKTNDTWESF